jgi:hypothetical protein
MRQRQPDGANLPPAGPQRIDDPAGDDEVRLRVVMAQSQLALVVDDRRDQAKRGSGAGDEEELLP